MLGGMDCELLLEKAAVVYSTRSKKTIIDTIYVQLNNFVGLNVVYFDTLCVNIMKNSLVGVKRDFTHSMSKAQQQVK